MRTERAAVTLVGDVGVSPYHVSFTITVKGEHLTCSPFIISQFYKSPLCSTLSKYGIS